jgi:hypothetical protein
MFSISISVHVWYTGSLKHQRFLQRNYRSFHYRHMCRQVIFHRPKWISLAELSALAPSVSVVYSQSIVTRSRKRGNAAIAQSALIADNKDNSKLWLFVTPWNCSKIFQTLRIKISSITQSVLVVWVNYDLVNEHWIMATSDPTHRDLNAGWADNNPPQNFCSIYPNVYTSRNAGH